MKHIFSAFAMAFVFWAGLCIHAEAADNTLLFATVDNIPPFVFVEDGKLTGISIEIIHELARRGGFEVAIETNPWARVLLRLRNGEVDGAFSVYESDERKIYGLYTGIIHYDELSIATRKDRQFPFSSLESLYGKVVGKGRDVFVGPEFDSAVREDRFILVEMDDMKMNNIKMLYAGRLDAVIGSPVALMYYAKMLGMHGDIVLLPTPLRDKIPAYLVLSKNSALKNKVGWQRKITALLDEMHADGTIRAINQKYGWEY